MLPTDRRNAGLQAVLLGNISDARINVTGITAGSVTVAFTVGPDAAGYPIDTLTLAVREHLSSTFTALPCDFTALPCDFTALRCDFTALRCDFTALRCDFTALRCVFTAVQCLKRCAVTQKHRLLWPRGCRSGVCWSPRERSRWTRSDARQSSACVCTTTPAATRRAATSCVD